ncbi:SDR family oxidoreductase [Vibrio sp. AK197]|uniref:SDR family oxidoreductase n=1 Tax=Vibrio olivae TaxID=1243002 RepID=A0ABV5HM80_9VIBR
MLVVTGATGQLGHLVIDALLKYVAASDIVAAVRNVEKAQDLADKGVHVRFADYTQPESLVTAFEGATKVLLISSSEVGQRFAQHKAVVDAAKNVGAELLAYTSILDATNSPLALAQEHKQTEAYIAESGVPAAILRNGWYSENYVNGIGASLEHGAMFGCAGEGKIASAPRADYAEAAAQVLTQPDQVGKVYELAGDEAFTLGEFADYLSALSGQTVVYNNVSEDEYANILKQVGLPAPLAETLANSETGAAKGGLFDDSQTLSKLIGRPTETIETTLKHALAAR